MADAHPDFDNSCGWVGPVMTGDMHGSCLASLRAGRDQQATSADPRCHLCCPRSAGGATRSRATRCRSQTATAITSTGPGRAGTRARASSSPSRTIARAIIPITVLTAQSSSRIPHQPLPCASLISRCRCMPWTSFVPTHCANSACAARAHRRLLTTPPLSGCSVLQQALVLRRLPAPGPLRGALHLCHWMALLAFSRTELQVQPSARPKPDLPPPRCPLQWAFEKLADTKYGVIPLKYRWVRGRLGQCDAAHQALPSARA